MPDPIEVVRNHIAAFDTRDLDRIVEDFTEDVVVQTPFEVIRGREELRTWFGGILELLPPGTDIVIDNLSSADDVVLITCTRRLTPSSFRW